MVSLPSKVIACLIAPLKTISKQINVKLIISGLYAFHMFNCRIQKYIVFCEFAYHLIQNYTNFFLKTEPKCLF